MIDGFQARALATPLQIPLIYGDGRGARRQQPGRRDGLPAQHRHGRDARPGAGRSRRARSPRPRRGPPASPWAFAPCLCVTRDERWGRTYESFGEDPALVDQMETVIDGLQGDGALSQEHQRARHRQALRRRRRHDVRLVDDGHYTIDQGVTQVTQAAARRAVPRAVQGRPCSSTASARSCRRTRACRSSARTPRRSRCTPRGDMITGVLKQQLGFDGFVISDWQGIDQIGPATTRPTSRPASTPASTWSWCPTEYANFEHDLTDLGRERRRDRRRGSTTPSAGSSPRSSSSACSSTRTPTARTRRRSARRAPRGRPRGRRRVAGAAEERRRVLPLAPDREDLRRRQQRRRPRQPDRRLDRHLAGRVRATTTSARRSCRACRPTRRTRTSPTPPTPPRR